MGYVEFCIALRMSKPTKSTFVGTIRTQLTPGERLELEGKIDLWKSQINLLEKDIVKYQALLKSRKMKNGNFKIKVGSLELKRSNREITSDRIREYKKMKDELLGKLKNAEKKLTLNR